MSVYWSFNIFLWIAAIGYFYMQIRKHNLPRLIVFDTAVLCLLFGLLIGHLSAAILKPWYIAYYWKEFFFSLPGWRAGIASFGVVAGVIAALFLISRLHHIPFSLIADLSTPTLFIGSTIGRLGCFFNGCCYGAPSSVPWAVNFNSITLTPPSHPVQLYESALSFLIFLLLPLITRWPPAKPGKGNFILIGLLLYFFERSFLEIFRIGGTSEVIFMGLSRILLISIISSLICLGLLTNNVKKAAALNR